MTYEDAMYDAYEWLTERFGERVAEALVPDAGGFWPLTDGELREAHQHIERWCAEQEHSTCAS